MKRRSGTPVLVSTAPDGRPFRRLSEVSTRKDDPHAFAEELPQCLVAECPELLPIREFLPSSTCAYPLAREVPVQIGDSGGRIDNLLVTNDGYLVIVEDKLFRNREAIREVVTQTLQYAMAVGSMRIRELEAAIRRGYQPALSADEGIVEAVRRLAENDNSLDLLSEDFEQALERNLRRGEILLLVVTDGIRVGVERVVQWLQTQASSAPFRFGLVELKFFSSGDLRVVVPRTAIATREISRHVVIVDVQPRGDVDVSTTVLDKLNTDGVRTAASRPVKAAFGPISKEAFLEERPPESRQSIRHLIDQLEQRGMEPQHSARSLRYGFSTDDGEFHSLVTLDWAGAWPVILKRDRDELAPEDIVDFKKGCNRFGRFFKDETLEKPDHSGAVAGKFQALEPNASAFAEFLASFRDRIAKAWDAA